MKSQKKGMSTVYFALIGLIIAIPIAVQFIAFGVEEGRQAGYLLGFYADDIAVLMESLQAVPGDVLISYPLDEDYTVTLEQGNIKVTHGLGLLVGERSFHLLPGMKVEEGESTGVLRLAKQDNTLTISGQAQSTGTTCPGTTLTDMSVSVHVQASAENAGLTQEELELLQHSFEEALAQAGVLASDQGTLTLILQSRPKIGEEDAATGINIVRASGQGSEELNYQFFSCSLLRAFPSYVPLQETILQEQSTGYELILNYNVNEEQARALLQRRGEYSQALANIFSK